MGPCVEWWEGDTIELIWGQVWSGGKVKALK